MAVRWLCLASTLVTLFSGCQCCPLFNTYANAIDDINDTHVYFDRCYNPRLDITRMGKPDWCGPINSRWCPCSCNNGCYDRYDKCNLYPPLTPYEFPSNIMPPPVIRTERKPREIDLELMDMTGESPPLGPSSRSAAPPAPSPSPPNE